MHTLFCAECTVSFDYKAIGVFRSHNTSGMAGKITRVLACDPEQLQMYKGMHLGPTCVHQNHARIKYEHQAGQAKPAGARATDLSPTYNKPASIMHWALEAREAQDVDFVLYIDADMLLRKPVDPVSLGARQGVVVSEHVGYLDTGIRNGLLQRFLLPEAVQTAKADLAAPNLNVLQNYGKLPSDFNTVDAKHDPRKGKRHASGGWYHIFHMSDVKKIAPRWLHWCKEVSSTE